MEQAYDFEIVQTGEEIKLKNGSRLVAGICECITNAYEHDE